MPSTREQLAATHATSLPCPHNMPSFGWRFHQCHPCSPWVQGQLWRRSAPALVLGGRCASHARVRGWGWCGMCGWRGSATCLAVQREMLPVLASRPPGGAAAQPAGHAVLGSNSGKGRPRLEPPGFMQRLPGWHSAGGQEDSIRQGGSEAGAGAAAHAHVCCPSEVPRRRRSSSLQVQGS